MSNISNNFGHLYSSSRSLRSASDTRIFRVSRVCRGTLGGRSFQYIGPVIWNSLSFSVRHATSLSFFKSKLKTHLLSSAYWFITFFLLFPSNPWQLCWSFSAVCGFVWLCMCVCVVFVYVCVCGCVCMACVRFEMNVLIWFCKCPGLSWDGVP